MIETFPFFMSVKLTFDDVLLVPQYSEILPRDTDPAGRFSRNIPLKAPLVSAAMDTVTESAMAIEMALFGGIGVIHKNLTPEMQAKEVALVKRFENGFIRNMEVLPPDARVEEAYKIRKTLGFKAVPITEGGEPHGKVLGLITANDFFIDRHRDLMVSERMTPVSELLTVRKGISLEEAREVLEESNHSKLLVLDEAGNLFAMVTRRDIEKQKDFPDATLDKEKKLRVAAAVGPRGLEERASALAEAGVDAFVVDTAHGHSKGVIDAVIYLKKHYPKIDVVAGNVATSEAVEALAAAGVDGVKVGIGPGSICTTRIISGVGVPQLSAIMDCAKAAQKGGIPLIADGGIKFSGDAAKAISAGANAVMLGSFLAGTKEAPGELIFSEGKTFKVYRGMGSLAAMKQGSADRYGQESDEESEKLVPEGIEGQTVYKGTVRSELFQIVGGLRSSMGYQGAKTITELHKKAKFVEISAAAMRESHPHSIFLSKEAPNYRS